MKTLSFLLQKEFLQIFRDKTILAIMFVMPTIQLGILPMAMNFEVKNLNLAIVDRDHSSISQKLISKIGASGYFKIKAMEPAFTLAMPYLEKGDVDVILEIPNSFERNLVREGHEKVNMTVDAINGTKSALGSSYLYGVIADFNKEIQIYQNSKQYIPPSNIGVASSLWFNPFENFRINIVPGVLVLLLTIVGGFLTSLNIVREKEVGTIEQINVTPVKKWQFILGKLVPFLVVGIIIFTIGLIVTHFIYGIVPRGNLLLLYAHATLYLIAILGFGLFVSTISDNQLQSMFISFLFMMIFILMSGLFSSVESMPLWANRISNALPITHFMKVVRMIIVKGSGFMDTARIMIYEIGFAILLNGLAIWNYRKTS